MKHLMYLFVMGALLVAARPALSAEGDEKGVLAALNAYRDAMLKHDAAGLDKVFHKDLTYSHSNGRLENKAEAIAGATKGPNMPQVVEFSDLKTRVYGTTGIVRGDTRIKSSTADLKLSVLYVFLKGPQGWQLVARQSTRYLQ